MREASVGRDGRQAEADGRDRWAPDPLAHHEALLALRFNDFIIALGWKGELIKRYMVDYLTLSRNLTVDLRTGNVTVHDGDKPNWHVDLVDTSDGTMNGGRIKRLAAYVGDQTFFLTFTDDVFIEFLVPTVVRDTYNIWRVPVLWNT